jgi:hypothetical protein
MAISPLIKLSLRGVLIWCLLSAAGFIFARPIASALSPMMESMIDAMQADFVADISIVDGHSGPVISLSCTATHQLVVPHGRTIPFLGTFKCASTDAIHALVPMVIYLVAVVGWPMIRRREILRRILGSLLLLPVVVWLTTPLLLVGLVKSRLHPESFSSNAQLTALLQPFVFMEMGGLWLLPLAAALVCIRIAALPSRNAAPEVMPASRQVI